MVTKTTKTVVVLKPAGDKILVKPDELGNETVTEGGIVIPHTDPKLVRHGVSVGTIVDIGPDAWKAYRKMHQSGREVDGQPWARIGDRIHFPPAAGRVIQNPETKETFKVMSDEDVLVIERRIEEEVGE